MEFKRVNRNLFSSDIYEQMKDKIKNGEWKEGEKIPSESELCNVFGVSRVSIRSAMDKLKGQSIINTYQGKGSFVSKNAIKKLSDSFDTRLSIDKEDYLDIIAFRSAIELACVDLIPVRAHQEDLNEIYNALELMKKSVNDNSEYTKADYLFHFSLIKASRNKIFIGIMDQNKDLFINYLKFQNSRSISTNFKYSIENHQAIYDSLCKGDVEITKDILRKSFERNRKRLFEE